MSIAFLFPGQGAQSPGFLRALPEHAAVSDTFAEASRLLDHDVLELDTADALESTAAVQLTLLIAAVAIVRLLRDEGVVADAVAGLSVGAFGAAVACGALTFADALALVRLRGEGMQRGFPRGFGMAAVIGLDEAQIQALIEPIRRTGDALYVANVNAPTQIVLTGSVAALDAAIAAARAWGARQARRMAVSAPSHCALLAPVALALHAALAGASLTAPRIPYLSNRHARAVTDARSVGVDLADNVMYPVRWHDATTVLFERGCRLFVELPPGRVLTDLAASAFPDTRAVALADTAVESVRVLAEREHAVERLR